MRSRLTANPLLIGAATVLIVIVGVVLAYNANTGLPFVPTYKLKAEVPDAANLVVGNDVKIGGSRVGAVSAMTPRTLPGGRVIAVLSLELDKDAGPLPVDTSVLVRTRSALGQKYVELTRGRSSQMLADGATIPLAHAGSTVEIDQFFNMFDAKTRAAAAANLNGFGTALAGRGTDLNSAIGSFRPLLRDLTPVMANLADPNTQLARFFDELGDAARILAPAASQQASLFAGLDATFGALREVARPYLQDSITRAEPALDAGIHDFPRQRPFLANATKLFRQLRPGAQALRGAAPVLDDALGAGLQSLPGAPALNRRLDALLGDVQDFSDDPLVTSGIEGTTGAVTALAPTLRYLAPAQTTCNYVTLFFRNISSLLSQGDDQGTWQRFIIVTAPQGPNSEGGPASAPANGPGIDNHLHSNPYPNTAAPGQPDECEAGNEPYAAGRTVIGNVAGTQQAATEQTGPTPTPTPTPTKTATKTEATG